MGRLFVGTAGGSYLQGEGAWWGVFYPEEIKRKDEPEFSSCFYQYRRGEFDLLPARISVSSPSAAPPGPDHHLLTSLPPDHNHGVSHLPARRGIDLEASVEGGEV